jgi:hypothetical protein
VVEFFSRPGPLSPVRGAPPGILVLEHPALRNLGHRSNHQPFLRGKSARAFHAHHASILSFGFSGWQKNQWDKKPYPTCRRGNPGSPSVSFSNLWFCMVYQSCVRKEPQWIDPGTHHWSTGLSSSLSFPPELHGKHDYIYGSSRMDCPSPERTGFAYYGQGKYGWYELSQRLALGNYFFA